MNAFWRDEPLNANELDLLEALFEGHRAATFRQNISSEVLKAAFMGSGDANQAVAAAVSTLGGLHAPIIQAWEVLHYSVTPLPDYIINGRVDGWGNSFIKGKPDEIWDRASDLLNLWPVIAWKIETITKALHEKGKKVYPNAACYTAAVATAIDMPKEISPMLVHRARLEAWMELIYDQQRQAPKV